METIKIDGIEYEHVDYDKFHGTACMQCDHPKKEQCCVNQPCKAGKILKQIKQNNMENVKAKLENGYRVTYKSGLTAIVIKNAHAHITGISDVFVTCNTGYMYFKDYNDKLEYITNSDYNIVKIEEPAGFGDILRENSSNWKTIWERSEEVILSMQEIADKFNIKIENLKIKK